MNERLVRRTLVALLLFNAVTMITGALFVVPSMPTDLIVWGPFSDYRVPALALGLLGVLSLDAAAVVLAIPALGAWLAMLAGAATTVFGIVEMMVVGVAVLETPDAGAAWTAPFFFTFGLIIAALAFALHRLHAPSRPLPLRPSASSGRV